MAIYTTFFLCAPAELPAAFPGWKLPLPEPVSRTQVNPFTQEEITVETREPAWDNAAPNEMEMPNWDVVAIDSDYETYLENRLPRLVQSKPHWCAKNLTSLEIEPLVAATIGSAGLQLETALYAPSSIAAGIELLPDEFVACLALSDEGALYGFAERWAAEMSSPEFTHSANGDRIQDEMTVNEALSVVDPIALIAKQRQNSESLYLLTEA